MKIMISQHEAMEKKVWDEIMIMFGLNKDDELWDNEQFILTEEQARELGLIQ
ncbi:hypothetical protein [Paenibacillus sp. GCM10028914]|uniref:hypothetical protein n=1 Tax=Paenibacillus sp. GCM10028914 TaxID=3273416 RepID=UPI003614BB2A